MKWDYQVVNRSISTARGMEEELKKFGERGWELVLIEYHDGKPRLYFKKIIEE